MGAILLPIIEFFGAQFTRIFGARIGQLILTAIAAFIGSLANNAEVQSILHGGIKNWIVDQVRTRLQMELDPNDPLSKASLGAAIGSKLGLQLDPNEPFSKSSIGAAVGRRVGLQLDPTDPFSKASLAAAVGQKVGLDLDPNDPFSKASFGTAVANKLGLNVPIRDISNREMFLEDIGTGITTALNNRIGTSFTRLYPVDTTIMQQFEREIVVQIEKAFAGEPSLIRTDTLNMIITRVRTNRGNLDPQTQNDAEKYIRGRAYSRKYYDRQSRDGYSRKWVKVNTAGVLIEYGQSPSNV